MGKLQVSIDENDRARLSLRGDGRNADYGVFEAKAADILVASASGVVVDLDGLAEADTSLIAALNAIARRAATLGRTVAVEVPIGCLDWLSGSELDREVRVERTAAPIGRRSEPVPARVLRNAPSPGAPRREGPGFVTSYGGGRICATSGCTTALSRYNNHDHCAVHWNGSRR